MPGGATNGEASAAAAAAQLTQDFTSPQ